MIPSGAYVIKRTGLPGSGKSYSVMMFIIEFLLEEEGVHYSNFPVNVDAFVEHFDKLAEDGKDVPTEEQIRRRIQVIPEDVEKTWRQGESGPWDYFDDTDLRNAWISLDEAHTFAGVNHPKRHLQKYIEFNGEMRHRGCRIEYVTQDPDQFAREVDTVCSYWIEVSNGELERGPNTGILISDWQQLEAKRTGLYRSFVREVHFTKRRRKYLESYSTRFWLNPELYPLYNSYSAPKNGGVAGKQEQPFERYTTKQLYWWFFKRNWWGLLFNRVTVCLGFFAFGGVVLVASQSYTGSVQTWDEVQAKVDAEKEERLQAVGFAVTEPAKTIAPAAAEPEAEEVIVSDEEEVFPVAILNGVLIWSDGGETRAGDLYGEKRVTHVGRNYFIVDHGKPVWLSGSKLDRSSDASGLRNSLQGGPTSGI